MADREERAFTLTERALTLAERARTVSSRLDVVAAPAAPPPADDDDDEEEEEEVRGADAQTRRATPLYCMLSPLANGASIVLPRGWPP